MQKTTICWGMWCVIYHVKEGFDGFSLKQPSVREKEHVLFDFFAIGWFFFVHCKPYFLVEFNGFGGVYVVDS